MVGTVLYVIGLMIALAALVYLTRVLRRVAHLKYSSWIFNELRTVHIALSVLYIITGVGCISSGMSQSVTGVVLTTVFILYTLGHMFATYVSVRDLTSETAS